MITTMHSIYQHLRKITRLKYSSAGTERVNTEHGKRGTNESFI